MLLALSLGRHVDLTDEMQGRLQLLISVFSSISKL